MSNVFVEFRRIWKGRHSETTDYQIYQETIAEDVMEVIKPYELHG